MIKINLSRFDYSVVPIIRKAAKSAKPIYHAELKMVNPKQWKDQWLLAYSGIADPQKFFDSLRLAGADLAQIKPFGDHHFFTRDDVTELLDRAKLMKAKLVTTAKDFVRLMGTGEAQARLAKETDVVNVDLVFEDDRTADIILDKAIARFEERQLQAEKQLRTPQD